MTTTIGAITLGQAPRNDVVPHIQRYLGDVRFVEAGALDGDAAELIPSLRAKPGEWAHVSRLADGSSTGLLSHERWAPLMQAALDRVVAQGAEVVVILCAADWSELESQVLTVNAGPLCDGVVESLAANRHLGVIRPRQDTADETVQRNEKFSALGITVTTTVLSPYAPDTTPGHFADVGRQLRGDGAEIIYMACMGMDEEMRTAVEQAAGCPVMSAQGVLGSIVSEVVRYRVPIESASARALGA